MCTRLSRPDTMRTGSARHARSQCRAWLGHRQLHVPMGQEAEGLKQKMLGSSAWVTGREDRFLRADTQVTTEVLTEVTCLGPFQPDPERRDVRPKQEKKESR